MNFQSNIASDAKRVDAIVFTAGSGGVDKTMMIDLDRAIKSLEAKNKKEITHRINGLDALFL